MLQLRGFRKKLNDNEDDLFDFEAWNKYLAEGNDEKLTEIVDHWIEEDESEALKVEKKSSKKDPQNKKPSKMKGRTSNKHQSKLLQSDREGCLPLHLALSYPNISRELLIKFVAHQPQAARISATTSHKLPLHLAVEHGHHLDVVKEIASIYEGALCEPDAEGKTPLACAMEVATCQSIISKQPYCWGTNSTTQKWQKQQKKTWSTVQWLLEETAKQASNPFAKLIVKDEEKDTMLLGALTVSAPPRVVALLVEASADRLFSIATLAWSALSLCIAGHYPLELLCSIVKVSPDKLGSIKGDMGVDLVGSQFTLGCFEPAASVDEKQVEGNVADGEWTVREYRIFAIERALKAKSTKGWDDEMVEWWEKVKFLVIFCGQCPEEENSALCDALSNPNCPPLVLELLLALDEQPSARSWKNITPIALAASTRTYVQKYHEINQIRATSTIGMMLDLGVERAAYCRYKDRLPLHYAIESGKTWTEMKLLVSSKRRTVRTRDPVTKLYPFQLAATRVPLSEEDMEWITLKRKNEQKKTEWNQLKMEEQEAEVQEAAEVVSLSRLRTVYELLRRSPTTLVTATRQTKPSKQLRDSSGMGMVGAHFALWCFEDVNRVFVPNYAKINSLLEVIEQGSFEAASSEIKDWWDKAKFWIWYCFRGEIGTMPKVGTMVMPRDDEYLLHAALSNSDTPPQIIHLLLNLYPEAPSLPLPGTGVVPLHLASLEDSYLPRRYEWESFPEATTMDLVLNSNPLLVSKISKGRLPLHLALESGKNWNEIEGLVVAAKRTLAMKDPVTGLFPFQLSAMQKSIKPEQRRHFQWSAHNSVSEKEWKKASTLDRNKLIRAEQATYQRNVLTTIFQLILVRPDLLESGSVDEPKVLVIKQQRSTVVHPNPMMQGRCDGSEKETTQRVNMIDEDEASIGAKRRIGAAAVTNTDNSADREDEMEANEDYVDDESFEKSHITVGVAALDHNEQEENVEEQLAEEEKDGEKTKERASNGLVADLARANGEQNKPRPNRRVEQSARGAVSGSTSKAEEVENQMDEESMQGANEDFVASKSGSRAEIKQKSEEQETGEEENEEELHGQDEEFVGGVRATGELKPTFKEQAEAEKQADEESTQRPGEEDVASESGSRTESEARFEEQEVKREEIAPPSQVRQFAPENGTTDKPTPESKEEAAVTDIATKSEATNEMTSTSKGPQASPTRGCNESREVKQTWLKSGEDERIYPLRSGWSASPRSRGQVNHFTAQEVDRNLPCLSCDDGKREALLLPCRHLCVCRRCSVKASSLKNCPLCNNPVTSTAVIHL